MILKGIDSLTKQTNQFLLFSYDTSKKYKKFIKYNHHYRKFLTFLQYFPLSIVYFSYSSFRHNLVLKISLPPSSHNVNNKIRGIETPFEILTISFLEIFLLNSFTCRKRKQNTRETCTKHVEVIEIISKRLLLSDSCFIVPRKFSKNPFPCIRFFETENQVAIE